MKNVFLDTNILIDYILNRSGGHDAEQLLMHGKNGDIQLAASLLTFANMAYILKGKVDFYDLFAMLTKFINVLPMDNSQLQLALDKHVRDFEDMLQYQCAKARDCEVIITNNKRDFCEFSELPIMTAEEFLTQLT
ncbi:MAG: PIN domain-containing protein [Prevotella ruminicola]|uniref:PIN domain-containing protein n=1 Tax=Xylanibacter ruminicola TaxID=839 RepID=A0A9D5P3Y0_XYLRU|nr:PIN domain-containing protein [Xylanibacter ruminicola]MBE7728014.1 PIN domain-containing protein [Enterocloster citroniae]